MTTINSAIAPKSNVHRMRSWVTIFAVSFSALLLFYPITQLVVGIYDYPAHIEFAREMALGTGEILPHPLFHFMLIGIQALTRTDWQTSALIVVMFCYILLGMVLLNIYLLPIIKTSPYTSSFVAVYLLVIGLLIASPLTFIHWRSNWLYFGYIHLHVHHNPTMHLLKPLSLLLFVFVVRIFSNSEKRYSNNEVAIAAVVTVLCGLAKPNYLIALLPPLALWSFILLLRQRQKVHWRLNFLGVLLPATLTLTAQIVLLPGANGDVSQISIQPFGFLASSGTPFWPPHLLLSIAFPLCVYILYGRKTRRDFAFNFAWVVFFCGLFYFYFVIETNRVQFGNFAWSGQITLLVLFAVSLRFLLSQLFSTTHNRWHIDKKGLTCLLIFTLHVVCGLVWYYWNIDRIIS